jgi:hypothetical protein
MSQESGARSQESGVRSQEWEHRREATQEEFVNRGLRVQPSHSATPESWLLAPDSFPK